MIASRIMPRTTLDIDTSIRDELRRRSERQNKSMGRVASELLATALAATDAPLQPQAFRWHSADLGASRVEITDKEALRRALDEP